MRLSPFKRDWRCPVSAAGGVVGAGSAEEEGGAGLITHCLLHSFLDPPAPSRGN